MKLFTSMIVQIYTTSQILLKYYLKRPQINVLVIWFGILGLSAVANVFQFPSTFFSNKHNFLNQYFVKVSWGWTLITLGPYMLTTAFVYGCHQWKKACAKAVFRLVIATCIWYFFTNIVFHYIYDITGVCISKTNVPNFNISTMADCKQLKPRHYWDGFDISGHCFLLSLIILVQASELQLQKHWDQIPSASNNLLTVGTKSISSVKSKFAITRLLVDILFVINCCLGILWHIMLIVTCIYFHTFLSKALGASAAILSWMLTYNNSWYSSINCFPGAGTFSVLWRSTIHKQHGA